MDKGLEFFSVYSIIVLSKIPDPVVFSVSFVSEILFKNL
jgi:hypothetical protein